MHGWMNSALHVGPTADQGNSMKLTAGMCFVLFAWLHSRMRVLKTVLFGTNSGHKLHTEPLIFL